jgi:RNA polymerase sigma-70 factor, ECF subfamily
MQNEEEQNELTQELIERSRDGDTSAFKQLVNKYSGYAFAVTRKIIFDKDDSKDIVQESFIRIWKHLKDYRAEIKFTTWLYRIVVNLCYDKIKSSNRRMMIFQKIDENEGSIAAATDFLENNVSNKIQVEMILKLVDDLPPKQKMVFLLRDIQGNNISETSEMLRISENSVKANLFNARKTIAERLSKMEERRG